MFKNVDDINNSSIENIEKTLSENILILCNEDSTIYELFDKIGIPIQQSNQQIISSEICRFRGKLVNSLMRHIVENSIHKETSAGKEACNNLFEFDLC